MYGGEILHQLRLDADGVVSELILDDHGYKYVAVHDGTEVETCNF